LSNLREPDLGNIDLDRNPFPIDVIVETCAHCNLRCIMCPYPKLERPKGEMEFGVFKKIVDEVAAENPEGRFWVAILGEPLLRGDKLVEMLRYARDKGLKNIFLNTNARYLDKEMTHKILDCGIKDLIISMDAATKETYDRIRPGGDFEITVRNIEYLLDAKRTKQLERPRVVMQFIVMDENENEIEAFKAQWLPKGAAVKVRIRMGWGAAVESPDLAQAEITRDFPCPWLLRSVSIHWDGRFSQCDADYEAKYSPGDIRVQTIREVWEGELARRREKHWSLDFSEPPCDTCKDWSVGRARWFHPDNS